MLLIYPLLIILLSTFTYFNDLDVFLINGLKLEVSDKAWLLAGAFSLFILDTTVDIIRFHPPTFF